MSFPFIRIALSLWLFTPFGNTYLVAQISAVDSLFYEKAVQNTVAVYYQGLGDQSGLFNGIQYAHHTTNFKEGGHPYFYATSMKEGSVVYDKVLYHNVFLSYDEVRDVLIFQDSKHRIQLHSDLVSAFSILDNHFIRLVKDSLNTALVSSGFYQVVYNGNTTVLKREIKTIVEDISSASIGIVATVKAKEYFYIKKNNTYWAIKNEKDLLTLFKDREKEVQTFIKDNKLDFKNAPLSTEGSGFKNTLTKTAAYYDQLTQQK